MGIKSVDAGMLKAAVLASAKRLESKKEWINELNVFPVPDGDTGTNMTMTIMAAAKEVAALEEPTMEEISKALSSGSLRGARGNSGVILSQLFRGFTKEIKPVDVITVMTLANAFMRATETAYKAVMKPKEGTILTVAKGMADKAAELATQTDDIEEFLRQIIACGDEVLSQTPEMLPVLKQAGVVDSGGQGLMEVMKGGLDGLLGRGIPFDAEVSAGKPQEFQGAAAGRSDLETSDIRYGYCTEFIINVEKKYDMDEEMKFKSFLESIGDSIVVVSDDDVVKVHVHTDHPGQAIEKALTYGSLSRLKIDNMREEHHERLIQNAPGSGKEGKAAKEEAKAEEGKTEGANTEGTKTEEPSEAMSAGADPKERKPYGFIAVSIGDGLADIFKGIGADYLIEGGQTMNPSTEDMLTAIGKVHAKNIFIFPNNKNIILAANQAQAMTKDKKVFVIPTTTVPQGITAMITYVQEKSAEENAEEMTEAIKTVKTGQVTYAVRDTHIDDKEIHQGDIMGIGDDGILAVGQDVLTVSREVVDAMMDEDSELVSIYYGADMSEDDAEKLGEMVGEAYPDCDVEVNYGGQPIYYCVISVE